MVCAQGRKKDEDSMQVTETLVEGLKREYRVVVPAADLDAKVNERLVELKQRVQIRGFRPGKVPVAHLKRVYGKAAMAETIEAAIREANAKIVGELGHKVAAEPKVTLPSEKSEVEGMIAGQTDLAYTVALEIVPKFELADFKNIKLERPMADVAEAEIEQAVRSIVEQNRPFAEKAGDAAAEKGDRLTVSFIGKIDGEAFEGGTAEDVPVTLGSGTFIPGFEDQLIGVKAGETRTVKSTFPKSYGNDKLAGKDAEFAVTVKSVEAPTEVTVDDAFAKSLGLESLDKLKEAVKDRLQREHAAASRQKVKRALLDRLDEMHKFESPPSLVEEEFANVWKTVVADLEQQGSSFAAEGTTEEAAKAEYRGIAERRVRLGLVLAEIGERNNIKVTEDEVSRAVVERARQFPGQEQQVWDLYRKNPNALASLRAPIYEEKVVDFLTELADVTEKPVSREELFKDDDAPPKTAAPTAA
jgi:trigger factor